MFMSKNDKTRLSLNKRNLPFSNAVAAVMMMMRSTMRFKYKSALILVAWLVVTTLIIHTVFTGGLCAQCFRCQSGRRILLRLMN